MGHLHRDPPNLISHPEPSRTWPFETSSASASEPSGTLSAMCTGQLSNFVCYLHRNHPELHGPSAPGPSELDQPSGTLQNLTVRDLIKHLHRNPPELCLLCAPDSSATLSAICTGTIRNFMGHLHRDPPNLISHPEPSRTWPFETSSGICIGTLRNFVCYVHLHRNHPELHRPSAPGPSELDQPSGTLQNLTVRDLIRHLHRNPPELCLLCAPDSSATLSAICTGTIRNFMGHLHRDPPNLISHPEPSRTWPFETSSGICIGTLRNFVCYVHRTAQQLCLLSAPEPSGTSWAICTGTLRTWSAIRNPPASHQPSTPEPSRTSSAFCPEPSVPEPFGTLSTICTRNLRNFISFLRRNPPEPHQPYAPEPLSAICTGTLRNFISQLPRNCPEPHQPSAPEPSGTSSAICTGRLRNPPEPSPEPGVAAAPDRTRAFLG